MKRRAFTLMEMLVALAIISVIVAGGFVATRSLNEERTLRAPLNELRLMAKKAWQQSMQEQRAWQIVLRKDKIIIQPKQAVLPEDQKLFKDADAQLNRGPGVESYDIDSEVRMEVKHWNDDSFHDPRPDVWLFEHSGLCEPISVRFITDYAVISVQFDPLTAAVTNETFEANK